ncbi:MAG: hypothetical protein KDC87_14750 [Planctomycetes bacterium]|nr:hypothetical protein [Planctomycetota bacterium]
MTAIHQGKLVDVYGLTTEDGKVVTTLFRNDVLVGLDIPDERDASTAERRDEEIVYDYLSANADTLQPRLLITRQIGSQEFNEAFANLDANVRLVSPNQFGRNTAQAPYTIVPRNAALRVTFSGKLPIDDSFFYEFDQDGRVIGVKNTEAIQLLKIVGDPNDQKYDGDFQRLDARIKVRDNTIIVDPVLLGTEGLRYGARNNAGGLPAAPDQRGANIRLAVALEGPLAIPGIKADSIGSLSGRNNDSRPSVIRDFRSGNENDNSVDLARGFLRDPQPPRLIGEMLMYLEKVEEVGPTAKLITIWKNDIEHEIDRGDLLRLFAGQSATPLASLEVLQDPADDLGNPAVQHVRVLVRPVVGKNPDGSPRDVLEAIDPSNDPNFPDAGPLRSEFLRKYAPKAVLVAEYTHRRLRPVPKGNDLYYGDDPRNFLSFNPTPLPDDNGVVIANENVSPFAGAVVRFNKPVDMSTLIALDTVFFATRNVLDSEAINQFVKDRNIDPFKFNREKFKTPHLIHSRIGDEDGSQTAIRVQPTLGFYLDQAMRDQAELDKTKPFSERKYHYFLHLVSGLDGIADLSGNPLDFQALQVPGLDVVDKLVMEFAIDTRESSSKVPRYEDNLVAYVVRRFAHTDEDERPCLYRSGETIPPAPTLPPGDALQSDDFFGPVSYLPSGEMVARPAARVTKVVDNINQIGAPPQNTPLQWCPQTVSGQVQVVFQTAATVFGAPIQNPLNPYGCRLQTVWREIDMSLSRTDPLDFNLDVEQMYWAPFATSAIYFDEFDQVSLFLGHSEFRPEPCISTAAAFPSMPSSGLKVTFTGNYAHNQGTDNRVERQPAPHPAYVDAVLSISAKDAILEPNAVNRFLPLPKFIDASKSSNLKNPYFVWRDEQETVQGGVSGITPQSFAPYPYLLSPFLSGMGRRITGPSNNLTYQNGGWYNGTNRYLSSGGNGDAITDGLVGTIALPLLADFWTYPDSPQKPTNDPFLASGINGWQISLAVTSSPRPDFRAYSAGRGGSQPSPIDPTHANWRTASGGFTPTGQGTTGLDNSVYWIMADFLKRTAVVTAGFVEISNPHRMPTPVEDPRLGPYTVGDRLPDYSYDFEPPLAQLPSGTSVITEFRGAGRLDSTSVWPVVGTNTNDATTFPLDPLKAGDAHIKHYDDRQVGGKPRTWWMYMYNRNLTDYTEKPNDLADSAFTNRFSGPFEAFDAKDVQYFNWRFIMKNNVEADPPVSPKVESFAISYRFITKN